MDWQDDLSRRRRRARLGVVTIWAITTINALWLALLVLVFAVPLPDRDVGWSTVVEYRDGTPAHVFLSPDERWRLEVDLDRVDPRFVASLIALEDKRFWSHDGVDPRAILRAGWSNLVRGRRVSGGSTLSMQLARLLEPRPRTVRSKLLDMFRALQLEVRLDKREILEAYLARTPYGGNIEGVESAAWTYFGHGARHLTPLEIATLLAVPQGPARLAPHPANTDRLRARRDAILGKLIETGVVTGADADAALADAAVTPPPELPRPMPRAAPHATAWLRARFPHRTQIRSTLDAGAQRLVERAVELRAPALRAKGIFGGAVVVVDHGSREVVALVGNLDFDDPRGGQIAMFARPRSPGSTLKPLLYALAIDRGLALPGYLVADVPSQYGTYRPRNFDDDFAGLVRLETALARSLNLPFVELLNRFGVERFVAELERMGVRTDATPGAYGLTVALGGIEVTPLALANLYATLAQDGRHQPLELVTGDYPVSAAEATLVFAPGAAYLTRQALATRDRPDFPRRREVHGVPPAIHWKTGTSFGLRDAWAAGSGPRHTAVVWTGNVDNKPSAELIGSEAAGPLLFDVLEGLSDRTRTPEPPVPPADLTEVEVCAYSGHVPGDACGERVRVLARLHAVPVEPCPYHQAFEVDRETGLAVLPACRAPQRDYERKTFVVLPSAVTAWLSDRRRAVPEAPVFADSCGGAPGVAPVMITPSTGQVVSLIPGVPAHQQRVPLQASTRARTVSWFVDGALVATLPATERAYWVPTPGRHEIVVTDDAGRRARRTLEVTAAAISSVD
jgi:penicillin-binding protein 1C